MIGIDTLVPTPDGPIRADLLLPGMEIFNKDGGIVQITKINYLESVDAVKVFFTGTGPLVTSPEQFIKTRTQTQRSRNQPYVLKRIADIQDKLISRGGVKQQQVELISRPLPYHKKELPVHPYLLGVLLGDGMLDYGRILISSPEDDMMERLQQFVPDGFLVSKDRNDYQWSILKPKHLRESKLVRALKDMGIYGSKSYNKHIPYQYQISSIEDRVNILQGLMDTDGWTGAGRKGSRSQFYTTSIELGMNVMELITSLGGICTAHYREYNTDDKPKSGKRHNYPVMVVELKTPLDYPPHWLPRKLVRYAPSPILKHVTAIKTLPPEPLVNIITNSPDKSIVVGMYHVIYHD